MAKEPEFDSNIIIKCTKEMKELLKDMSYHNRKNTSEMVRDLITTALTKYKNTGK